MTVNQCHQQQILKAAEEFFRAVLAKLKNEKGVHAETAIATASRMAGRFLLRSFNLPIANVEPGSAVFSDVANEKGPLLINLLGSVLAQKGVNVDAQSIAAAKGKGDKPQLTVSETQSLVEPVLTEIRDKYGLTLEESARAATVTTGILIKQCAAIVDPSAAFNSAAYGFVEGSKTALVPLSEQKLTMKKPWYKPW